MRVQCGRPCWIGWDRKRVEPSRPVSAPAADLLGTAQRGGVGVAQRRQAWQGVVWALAALLSSPPSAVARPTAPAAAPTVDRALQRRCADPKRRDTRECVQLRQAAHAATKSPAKDAAGAGRSGRSVAAKVQGKPGAKSAAVKADADDEKPRVLSAKEKKQIAALRATCGDRKQAKSARCKAFFAAEQERAAAAERAKLQKLCKEKKAAKTAQCKKFLAAENKKRQTVSVCGRKYGIAKKNEKVAAFAKRYRIAEATLRSWNALGSTAKLKGGKRYLVKKSPHDGVTLRGGVLLEGDDQTLEVQRPPRGWGKPLLVDTLRLAAQATQRQSPLLPHLILGDLSKEGGGCLPPHKSHRGGIDADVGYYMRGAHQRRWLGGATPETLDADRTWQLLRAFLSTGKLQFAFIDYALQQPLFEAGQRAGEPQEHLQAWFQWPRPIENAHETVIRHLGGHDNHMHVRFQCDSEDACTLPDDARERLERARIEMLGGVAHEPARRRTAGCDPRGHGLPAVMQ